LKKIKVKIKLRLVTPFSEIFSDSQDEFDVFFSIPKADTNEDNTIKAISKKVQRWSLFKAFFDDFLYFQ